MKRIEYVKEPLGENGVLSFIAVVENGHTAISQHNKHKIEGIVEYRRSVKRAANKLPHYSKTFPDTRDNSIHDEPFCGAVTVNVQE